MSTHPKYSIKYVNSLDSKTRESQVDDYRLPQIYWWGVPVIDGRF